MVVLLALIWPLIIFIILMIKIFDPGPIIFKQKRVGKNAEVFDFYKFRSMPVNTGYITSADAENIKLTWIGKLIRRTNLDELPQLFNVLIGDMSMIGPRPCIAKQKELIKMRENNGSISCLPGLTGLAQVMSYDNMPESEKAKYDGVYCSHLTFLEDVRIVIKTFLYFTKEPPKY